MGLENERDVGAPRPVYSQLGFLCPENDPETSTSANILTRGSTLFYLWQTAISPGITFDECGVV